MKKFFIGFLVLVVVIVVAVVVIFKASSHDLSVAFDPDAFDRITEEYDIDYDAGVSEYCISCDNVLYSEPTALEGDVNSSELTSIVQTLNNKNGVLKEIQLKLGDNNQGEMSAVLDLSAFGIDMTLPIYADGSFSVQNNSIAIHIDRGKIGLISASEEYVGAAEEYLSDAINGQLSQMPELSLENVSVEEGILLYRGVFPRVIKMK